MYEYCRVLVRESLAWATTWANVHDGDGDDTSRRPAARVVKGARLVAQLEQAAAWSIMDGRAYLKE